MHKSQSISFAKILESKIGLLSIRLIDSAETGAVDVEHHEILLNILSEISRDASRLDRDTAFKNKIVRQLKSFLKSSRLSRTYWVWIHISRRIPSLWEEIANDPLIKNRVEHIEKMCEISELFSDENLRSMTGGIQSARQFLLTSMIVE